MRIRPIFRKHSSQYFLNLVVAFAISVIATRLFLSLMGYPQLGGEGLHIAHVIWGGIGLFLSVCIVLIFKNHYLMLIASILAGAGWGLFIDEIGKFLTSNNNYFYRPAAPIIYVIFLSFFLLAIWFRRRKSRDPKTKIYQVLEDLEDVIESDFEERELFEMQSDLRSVVKGAQDRGTQELAATLLDFISSEKVRIKENRLPIIRTFIEKRSHFILSILSSEKFLNLLLVFLLLRGLVSIGQGIAIFIIQIFPPLSDAFFGDLFQSRVIESDTDIVLFLLMNFFRLVVAILLVIAAIRIKGKQSKGFLVARIAFVLSIGVVDIFEFYFNQFGAALSTIVDLGILYWIDYYQRTLRSKAAEEMTSSQT